MTTELIKYIQYKFKKKFGNMNNQNDAMIQRYKKQYFGKMYKWSRPINGEEVGDIVRVVDVKQKGDMVMLVFNSGSPLNLNLIDSYMQPCADEQPEPSMYANEMMNEGGGIAIPEELKEYVTPKISFSAPEVQAGRAPNQAMQQPVFAEKKKSDMFALFQSEEKDINLPLKIKMPDIALVKMMYNNAADKDTFIAELAEYVISGISLDIMKTAMSNILCDKPTQESEVDTKHFIKVNDTIVDAEQKQENIQQEDEHQ